jgi:hypothetical protein
MTDWITCETEPSDIAQLLHGRRIKSAEWGYGRLAVLLDDGRMLIAYDPTMMREVRP